MPFQKGHKYGRWKPGESGNPGGRPKGVAARVQEACGGADYPSMVEAYRLLVFGTPAQRKKFFGEDVRLSAKDRLSALNELRDMGPGKPRQGVDVNTDRGPIFALPEHTRVDVGGIPPPQTEESE